MHVELAKIERYFEEGKRLWAVNAELVISRQFYVQWEDVCRPLAFAVGGEELTVLGQALPLLEQETRVGHFSWNTDEMCASLVIEGQAGVQTFLLGFVDGEPDIGEVPPVLFGDSELSFGERLEVMYDVIAYVRRHYPARDVLALTKREYTQALRGIASGHSKQALRVMRQLSVPFVKRLLSRAAEDMALDDLSDQLALPLDGNYSASAAVRAAAAPHQRGTGGHESVVAARTPWCVFLDVEFLARACSLTADAEQSYSLSFSEHEEMGVTSRGETTLRVTCDPDMPLTEGARLRVFRPGESSAVATFDVDLFEGTQVYGRLSWMSRADTAPLGELKAIPPGSPTPFLAKAVAALRDMLRDDAAAHIQESALAGALGLCEVHVTQPSVEDTAAASSQMDALQGLAWAGTQLAQNRIILVQGPPGTGKTSVLEQVVRGLCAQGKRLLVTAPSNTAVDNICRRLLDLPILRLGLREESIAPDVVATCWAEAPAHVQEFLSRREQAKGGAVYAGTHLGVLRGDLTRGDWEKHGLFDVLVFDEAGMTRLDELLLCLRLGERAVLFGDHHQLAPYPLPRSVLGELRAGEPAPTHGAWAMVTKSALQWLIEDRGLPITVLQHSFRCQNPRLMRFASTLFYDARVRTSEQAEYYRLSYAERQSRYPPSTLRLYSTSKLPLSQRAERLVFEGKRPGLENAAELQVCVRVFYELAARYPLREITFIAPYRRQVRLLRRALAREAVARFRPGPAPTEAEWREFLVTRIATVDSFQGGESDAVVISYVRSNDGAGVGFVDDPNRVNVAHTRCRREMLVVADIECLKAQAHNRIFQRMERAFRRDGEIIEVDSAFLDWDPEQNRCET